MKRSKKPRPPKTEKQLAVISRMREALSNRAGINERKKHALVLIKRGVTQAQILKESREKFGMGIGVSTLIALRQELEKERAKAERRAQRLRKKHVQAYSVETRVWADPDVVTRTPEQDLARQIAKIYIKNLTATGVAELVLEAHQ